MEIFRKLGWFFKQEKKSYIMGVLLLLVVALLQLVPPLVIGIVVDLIHDGTVTTIALVKWIGFLIVAALIAYVFRYLWRIKIYGSAVKLSRQLRSRLYEHFTIMPTSFYQRKRIGDLMAHATNDLSAVQQTAGNGVLSFVDSLTTGGFVIIAMSLIDWRLTILSLLPLPFIALSTSYYGKLIHQRFKSAQAAFSDLNDKAQESVTGIKVIKTFGQEAEDVETFRQASNDVVNKNMAVARIDALYDPTIGLMAGIAYFITIGVGAIFVLDGSLTIGQLVSFTTYLGLLIWPMLAFGWLFNIVQRGNASYDRIMELLQEKPEIVDESQSIKERASGDIKYDVKSFSYPNEEEPALRDIHLTIRRGETLGVVGRTGAGKTTFLKLLIREFIDWRGDIRIGEHSITDYALASLREAIGYVPQDHFLFSATVGENIAFAAPDASQREIERSANLANIHEDIAGFANGYETIVGERGVSLSGGQKQRLSIARALMMNPEILILDDSLSAVDAKTEETILQNLKKERASKTTIITAHRLSAVQHAEQIVVMDEGTIIQHGTHEELMKKEGWYRDMYHQQQLEELVEQGKLD